MERLCGTEDCLATDPVAAAFNTAAADQVYLPAEYLGQLIFHLDLVEQASAGVFGEGAQHVYIGVRRKSSRRTEPKKANSAIFHLRQEAPIFLRSTSI